MSELSCRLARVRKTSSPSWLARLRAVAAACRQLLARHLAHWAQGSGSPVAPLATGQASSNNWPALQMIDAIFSLHWAPTEAARPPVATNNQQPTTTDHWAPHSKVQRRHHPLASLLIWAGCLGLAQAPQAKQRPLGPKLASWASSAELELVFGLVFGAPACALEAAHTSQSDTKMRPNERRGARDAARACGRQMGPS